MSSVFSFLCVKIIYMINYFIVLITALFFDIPWLFTMGKSFYGTHLAHLMADKVNFLAAGIFYMLYAVGVLFFVISPALKNGESFLKVFLAGCLFGLIAYATYDLTNHSSLKDWPIIVTVVDMIWGTILTGVSSVIAYSIIKLIS